MGNLGRFPKILAFQEQRIMAVFENLLRELAARTGLENFPAGEPVTLRFNGEYIVTIHYDEEAKAIVLSSPLLVDEPGGESRLCATLMAASNLGAQTRGAAFGLDPDTGEVYLWRYLPDFLPDYCEFERALEGFVGQVAHWRNVVLQNAATGRQSAAASASSPGIVPEPGLASALMWEQMRA